MTFRHPEIAGETAATLSELVNADSFRADVSNQVQLYAHLREKTIENSRNSTFLGLDGSNTLLGSKHGGLLLRVHDMLATPCGQDVCFGHWSKDTEDLTLANNKDLSVLYGTALGRSMWENEYSSEGRTVELGIRNLTLALSTLDELEMSDFVSLSTRVFVLEFSILNRATGLVTSCRMICEFGELDNLYSSSFRGEWLCDHVYQDLLLEPGVLPGHHLSSLCIVVSGNVEVCCLVLFWDIWEYLLFESTFVVHLILVDLLNVLYSLSF